MAKKIYHRSFDKMLEVDLVVLNFIPIDLKLNSNVQSPNCYNLYLQQYT